MEINERQHLSCSRRGTKGRRLNIASIARMGPQKKYARCRVAIVDIIDTILLLDPLTFFVSSARVQKG